MGRASAQMTLSSGLEPQYFSSTATTLKSLLINGHYTKIVWVLMRAIEKGPYGAIAHGAVISIMYDVRTNFLFLIHEAWFGKTDAAKATALGSLTQWILTDELEKAHPTCLTQNPARSGFIPITFLNQTKVDSFGLIPPRFNNDMNMYSGHLKTALNSQKVYYAP